MTWPKLESSRGESMTRHTVGKSLSSLAIAVLFGLIAAFIIIWLTQADAHLSDPAPSKDSAASNLLEIGLWLTATGFCLGSLAQIIYATHPRQRTRSFAQWTAVFALGILGITILAGLIGSAAT